MTQKVQLIQLFDQPVRFAGELHDLTYTFDANTKKLVIK